MQHLKSMQGLGLWAMRIQGAEHMEMDAHPLPTPLPSTPLPSTTPYRSLLSYVEGNTTCKYLSTRQGLLRFNQDPSSQGLQLGLVNSVGRFMEG